MNPSSNLKPSIENYKLSTLLYYSSTHQVWRAKQAPGPGSDCSKAKDVAIRIDREAQAKKGLSRLSGRRLNADSEGSSDSESTAAKHEPLPRQEPAISNRSSPEEEPSISFGMTAGASSLNVLDCFKVEVTSTESKIETWTVMEYMPAGSVKDLLAKYFKPSGRKRTFVQEEVIAFVARQVLEWAYRQEKAFEVDEMVLLSQKLLLDFKGNLKIAGYYNIDGPGDGTQPERRRIRRKDQSNSKRSSVTEKAVGLAASALGVSPFWYSFGLLCIELATTASAFSGQHEIEVYRSIASGNGPSSVKCLTGPAASAYSGELFSFIDYCLRQPKQAPPCLEHPFVKKAATEFSSITLTSKMENALQQIKPIHHRQAKLKDLKIEKAFIQEAAQGSTVRIIEEEFAQTRWKDASDEELKDGAENPFEAAVDESQKPFENQGQFQGYRPLDKGKRGDSISKEKKRDEEADDDCFEFEFDQGSSDPSKAEDDLHQDNLDDNPFQQLHQSEPTEPQQFGTRKRTSDLLRPPLIDMSKLNLYEGCGKSKEAEGYEEIKNPISNQFMKTKKGQLTDRQHQAKIQFCNTSMRSKDCSGHSSTTSSCDSSLINMRISNLSMESGWEDEEEKEDDNPFASFLKSNQPGNNLSRLQSGLQEQMKRFK